MDGHKHKDCENFIPIDVFKGLCRLDKEMVSADEEGCEKFKPVKKCRFCKNYARKEEFLGICTRNRRATYPDLLAKRCEYFEWIVERYFYMKRVL